LAVRRFDAGRGERGFTLIEIAVVLLILAIAAAFVVPQILNHMRAYRLGVGARNLATALQRARFLATSDNTRAGVVIKETSSRIDIEEYDEAASSPPQNKGVVVLPQGINIVPEGPRSIAFDGRGIVTPIPKENAVFRVNGAKGYYMLVTVSPTGQVTLSETKNDG
jgi:prepilin-type N-terminal cleavage/methylation domain-containing protein